MIYGSPENPTREDVRREYVIANMRFKELRDSMQSRDSERASEELGYVRAYLENRDGILVRHASTSLTFADAILSAYRGETIEDLRTAAQLHRDLHSRFHTIIQTGGRFKPDRFGGSSDINSQIDVNFELCRAARILNDVKYQHQNSNTYTEAIDKAMFHLGEAEKIIVEAEQKPVGAGV